MQPVNEKLGRGVGLLAGVLCLLLWGCEPRRTPPPPSSATPSPAASATGNAPQGGSAPLLDSVRLADGEASLVRNLYFIFDGSGSMKEDPCGSDRFDTKLEGAQWAVRTFLEKVPAEVNLGLYLFDRRGERQVVALGSGNREEFLAAVDGIRAGGGTPLAAAIRSGTEQLVEQYKTQLGYGEYRLVVVTDGEAREIPEAAGYATQWGMPIYGIGLCIDEDHPLRRVAVSYRAADSSEDLARGLEATLAELPSFDATEFETESPR